jgi:hypothetical protein
MKKHLYRLFCAIGIAIAALLPAGAAHADFINPSFESTDTWRTGSAWTYKGPANFSPVITESVSRAGATFTAADGDNLLYMGTAIAAAERKVYQTFTLTHDSDLTLWYAVQGTGTVTLRKPDGTVSSIYAVTKGTQTGWLNSIVHLTAGEYTLTYSVTGKSSWGVYDGNIQAAVPIPAGIWLLGFGLTGIAVLRKRVTRQTQP